MEKPEEQQTMLKIAIAADFPNLNVLELGFPNLNQEEFWFPRTYHIYICMYKLYM